MKPSTIDLAQRMFERRYKLENAILIAAFLSIILILTAILVNFIF